jgi:hypothetical protein
VACRLDRFLVVETLLEEDPAIEANILPKTGSDHWPISFLPGHRSNTKIQTFHFEKFWLSHPDFQRLAKSWWAQAEIEHGTCMYKFQQRLKNFKQLLKLWNKTTFGNIFQRMQEIESRLEALQRTFISGTRTTDLMKEEEELRTKLEERKKQEEILWRQKSRVQWLKEGERNTKFFHKAMVHHRYINRITQLEDAQGNPIREHNQIVEELNTYYKELLTETNEDREEAIQKITRHIPSLVTQEKNEALMRPITQEEVDHAVKEMPSESAWSRRLHHGFLSSLLGSNQGRGVGPRPSFVETLVVFDHFWDFDRLVEDGAPRRSRRSGSRPFCGIFGF